LKKETITFVAPFLSGSVETAFFVVSYFFLFLALFSENKEVKE